MTDSRVDNTEFDFSRGRRPRATIVLETGKGTANSGKERGKWRRLEACVTCKRCEQASVVLNVQHVQAQKAGGIMAQAATTDMLKKCSFCD